MLYASCSMVGLLSYLRTGNHTGEGDVVASRNVLDDRGKF